MPVILHGILSDFLISIYGCKKYVIYILGMNRGKNE